MYKRRDSITRFNRDRTSNNYMIMLPLHVRIGTVIHTSTKVSNRIHPYSHRKKFHNTRQLNRTRRTVIRNKTGQILVIKIKRRRGYRRRSTGTQVRLPNYQCNPLNYHRRNLNINITMTSIINTRLGSPCIKAIHPRPRNRNVLKAR